MAEVFVMTLEQGVTLGWALAGEGPQRKQPCTERSHWLAREYLSCNCQVIAKDFARWRPLPSWEFASDISARPRQRATTNLRHAYPKAADASYIQRFSSQSLIWAIGNWPEDGGIKVLEGLIVSQTFAPADVALQPLVIKARLPLRDIQTTHLDQAQQYRTPLPSNTAHAMAFL